MGRIDDIFARLRDAQGGPRHGALMPYVCGGSPADVPLADLLPALERGGASIVEIGIPFSDPVADGPVIAAAMHGALERGATVDGVLREVAAARDRVSLGLVAMVSASIVHRKDGPSGFFAALREAGLDGVIVPDLTLEEAEPYRAATEDTGLSLSLLVGPSTPPERAGRIADASSGFVYLLARAGTTGTRSEAPEIAEQVARIRAASVLPIACGFGVSTADHVRAVVAHADAAIVGTAMVDRLERASDPVAGAERFARELAAGLGGAPTQIGDSSVQAGEPGGVG